MEAKLLKVNDKYVIIEDDMPNYKIKLFDRFSMPPNLC